MPSLIIAKTRSATLHPAASRPRFRRRALGATLLGATLLGAIAGCGAATATATEVAAAEPAPAQSSTPRRALARDRFNILAVRMGLPLFWRSDADGDGAIDPGELFALRFYDPATGATPTGPTGEPARYTDASGFTQEFDRAYELLLEADRTPPPDDERRKLVRLELDGAAPTLVYADLRELPESHRAFAEHMLRAGDVIDALYAEQVGMTAMASQLADDDLESRALFRRNWGARCQGRSTESNPACTPIAGARRQPVAAYPREMQSDDGFCATLEGRADATSLLSPFTVVRRAPAAGGASQATGTEGAPASTADLVAVPYTEAYREAMTAIATELDTAAAALIDDPEESALRAYLMAAAEAFRDNDWGPADEAWSRMNARNSRWYVRIAPDETYWEPCNRKAGFHMTFAQINRDSLEWQDRLTPIQGAMEQSLAALVRGQYRAREVQFHMPDFIDIVTNHGDDRTAFGATIGQSLPNWGPVADEGRGRTVAMSNLFTDEDSVALRRAQAASMLAPETMAELGDAATPGLLSTILHEATHNLGPAHDYRYRGRTADDAFGGNMASMLEELKAQCGALFLLELLRERDLIDETLMRQSYLDSIVWALSHISRGMYTTGGQRKAYGQLAAIQVGFLLDDGALRFDPEAPAADGRNRGAFTLDFARMPAAARALMTRVMAIMARNDRPGAEALAATYVDGDRVPRDFIVERYRDAPQTSFVYAVDL